VTRNRAARQYGSFPEDFGDRYEASEFETKGYWVGWALVGGIQRLIVCYSRDTLVDNVDGDLSDYGFFVAELLLVVESVTKTNIENALGHASEVITNRYSVPID
jgi:hypothetical protein